MNKIKIKLLLIFLLGFQTAMVNAAASQWTSWYPVNQVYTYSDGSFLMSLNPGSAHLNPAGCASASWLRVMPDQVNVDEMYKMALTAQAADLKINAYVSGTECAGSNIKVFHLRTLKG
jgi:hypothetical protein